MESESLVDQGTGTFARERNDEAASEQSFPLNENAKPTTMISTTPRRWTPGVRKIMPWKFLFVLLGTVIWASGCIGVIIAADNSKVDSWTVSPTVIFAILGPLASMLLQYALSCGLVITWWNSALQGTALATLHRQWDHGTSILAASASGRHMDKIALAKIMVLSVFAVNPLLQRSISTTLTTEIENVALKTRAATNVESLRNMNFTDAYVDNFGDPVQLAPQLNQIMQQFTNREPIMNAISGCTGNCSGTLVAAGVDAQCSKATNTSFYVDFGSGAGGATSVFKTGTTKMGYRTHADFNLTVFFAETHIDEADDYSEYNSLKSCQGVSTNITCVLQHAVIEYSFSLRDQVITPQTSRDRIRIVSVEPTLLNDRSRGEDYEPIFGGVSIAADSIFNSSGAVQTMSKYGWALRTSGPLTATYFARGGNDATCSVDFDDPTEDILSKLNEIILRIALAAPNASSPVTEIIAQQQTAVVIYESRYAYLWGALAIAVLAATAVGWTASGFNALGRPVSLSPAEIAMAFGSPLLQKPGTSALHYYRSLGLRTCPSRSF